jgi:hypothetical protein
MKKAWFLVVTFVFLVMSPLAFAAPGPNNPPVPVPPNVPLQRVELRCEAGERVCDFRISLNSGGNIDVVVRRVGQLPRKPPRVIRVPGPVRRIVKTVTPPPRIIRRTIRPEPRVITRTRTRTIRPAPRTVTPPPVTVTENAGPPIINRPRPTTTVTAPPPVQSTADAPGLPRPVRTVTAQPAETPTRTRTETVTETETKFLRIPILTAATVGIGLVILGIALALLALYAVYVLGYKQGESQDARNFSTLLGEIRRK